VAPSWEPFGSARRLTEESERAERRAAKPARSSSPPASRGPSRPGAPRALRREPARKLVVVTCMDARIDPLRVLNLGLGDANVIRNAGVTVSDDVLRSLRVSQSLLGARRAVLIGHTDCAGHPSDQAAEAAIRDGLRRIRGSAGLPDAFGLEGLMYDLRTGTLRSLG
jgi:carbonic anhydrase